MLDEEFSFLTWMGGTIRVRVVRGGASNLTHEQRVRGDVAAQELRLGMEWGDAPILRAARELHQALFGLGSFQAPLLDGTTETQAPLRRVIEDLQQAFQAGRLVVTQGAVPLLGIAPEFELVARERPPASEAPLPSIARPPPPSQLTFFEVRFVDEVGQAIGGLEVEFAAGARTESTSTNPAGVALLENVTSMSASVGVVSTEALGEILDPRWGAVRTGTAPTGVNTTTFPFTGSDIAGVALKPAVPNTVVITPALGTLFVELWDKTGRVRYQGGGYSIEGPVSLSGEVDEKGRLLHEDVPRGDYQLTLTVEIDAGKGETFVDEYTSPLVVLEAKDQPQVRMLGVLPRVVMARMRGLLFDTNKSFLLPSAIEAVVQIRGIYQANNPSELLIVGHTDTTAQPDINDPLSVERADSIKAYLEDDVDAWLANYDLSGKKRWGSREDRLMISATPDFASRPAGENLIVWYQRTRDLEVDGIAGKQTRTALITEYMALDGVKLSEEPEFKLSIQTHGAGENFPLKDTGFELDQKAADEREDPFDRRVELFFFDPEFKITPAPGAPDGDEYLEWRKRSAENDDFPIEGVGRKLTQVEFDDALFRTDSCVILPEGERPDAEEHESLTTSGLVATVLRFNADHKQPGPKLLVAGHTDTTADVEFNQTLSEERARVALALLVGDRDEFRNLCDARHQVADYKQILSWVDAAFPDLAFGCKPAAIDDNSATGIEPVRRFQEGYNRNKADLGATGPDLDPDGDMGPLTWGAIFDVYEFALAQELQLELEELADLRELLLFVDDANRSLGFSEHHPIEAVGKDNFRSQTNRRVEVLFFDVGEEPDVELAKDEPDISELYIPGFYERIPLTPGTLPSPDRSLVAARLPTRFSKGRTFPKPSALPLLSVVLEEAAKRPGAKILIIGHADGVGSEPTNQALSLARADAVQALLTKDEAFFKKRFEEPDPVAKWDWEEVQWMLYGVRFEGVPHYVGSADNHAGPLTQDAVGRFQLLTDDLHSHSAMDKRSLERLIQQYFELLPDQLDPARITTLGAGSTHPPLPFGVVSPPPDPEQAIPAELESPDLRRVEIFIVEGTLHPPIKAFPIPASDDFKTYSRWVLAAQQELTAEPAAQFLQVVDKLGRPVSGQSVTISRVEDGEEEAVLTPVASATTNKLGLAEFQSEPGLLQLESSVDGQLFAEFVVFHPDDECGVNMFLPDLRFPFVRSEEES